MLTIAIASQKGGAGKTTLTAHLSCAAALAGHGPVYILDADPQGTLTSCWATPRKSESPILVTASPDQIASVVSRLRAQGQKGVLLIDTQPGITRTVALIIAAADYVLIPVQPSPQDLDAVGATVDLVVEVARPFAFILNRATKRSSWTAPAVAELSQHGPVCPRLVHDWVALKTGFIDGTSVVETAPASEAAAEIMGVWSYVTEDFRAKARRRSINQSTLKATRRAS